MRIYTENPAGPCLDFNLQKLADRLINFLKDHNMNFGIESEGSFKNEFDCFTFSSIYVNKGSQGLHLQKDPVSI